MFLDWNIYVIIEPRLLTIQNQNDIFLVNPNYVLLKQLWKSVIYLNREDIIQFNDLVNFYSGDLDVKLV